MLPALGELQQELTDTCLRVSVVRLDKIVNDES